MKKSVPFSKKKLMAFLKRIESKRWTHEIDRNKLQIELSKLYKGE